MQKRKERRVERLANLLIVIFILITVSSFLIVLNKGKIGNYSLVYAGEIEKQEEETAPLMELQSEKKYISSISKEKTKIIITIDGIEETEGVDIISSNESVVKIKDGVAIASKNGTAIITGSKGALSASTTIHVITPIKTIKLKSTSSSIKVGEELQLSIEVIPSEASTDTLKYKSNDESIATVDSNAMIKGVSKGKVTFTVYDEYTGKESTATVIVK